MQVRWSLLSVGGRRGAWGEARLEGSLRHATSNVNQLSIGDSFNNSQVAGMPRRPPAVDDYASAVPHVQLSHQLQIAKEHCANIHILGHPRLLRRRVPRPVDPRS
jgi:hypothetical protein